MTLLGFVDVVTVFWLILGAAVIHVAEEYYGGFVDMMKRISPMRGMTAGKFALVNSVFIALCLCAVAINSAIPVYSLSISALILINSLIHVAGAVKVKGYAAGLITSVFLFVPLSVSAYILYCQAGLLDSFGFALSFAVGATWMGFAAMYGLASSRRPRKQRN